MHMPTRQVTYQIWFKDSIGWYCPGSPWTNPDCELVKEYRDDILIYKRKDIAIRAFIDGKYSRVLSLIL